MVVGKSYYRQQKIIMKEKSDSMIKKSNRLKSALISGVMAIASIAAPITTSVAPALTANAADTDNYAKLLQYSLYFYDANMCGNDVGTKSGMSWRGNCHTNDEVPGGFHDAGDHAMFGLPQGFTAATLGWSYYEFKDAFDATGQGDHLKMITDHFCDFFKRSTKLNGDSVSNFLYQKGDGDEDHGYWGPPEKQGGRQMFWTNNGASDIAAEYAAALAVNYLNFGNSEDLTYAKALYKFSTQYNQCATYGPEKFYNSKVCADEQAWAAGWLYLATKQDNYLNDLKSKLPEIGWVHGWNDAHLGAACLLGHATGDWSRATGYIGSKANGGGYMFLDKWGSARLNCSMQFTALVATVNGKGNYSDWAKGQMNYILGQNTANTCFVTGYASNSAKNAHHRAASGYSSYEEFNMNNWNPDGNHMSPYCAYGGNSHTLIGALVGGPWNAEGDYHDNMSDYICNEVAIDYNAGLVGAAAGLYHFYKTGSIDNSIEGVTKIYNSTPPEPVTEPITNAPQPVTNAPQPATQPATSGGGQQTSESGKYTLTLGDSYDYGTMDEKMFGWKWSEFNIPSNEKVTKVEVNLSANSNIGKWQGAFGTSTKVSPDYWTQSEDMQQNISSSKGTVTWNVDADTSDIIQRDYGGELKFGVWWIDCQKFTVDSVVVYTDGKGTPQPATQAPTKAPATQAPTKAPTQSGNDLPNPTFYGDADLDNDCTINDVVMLLCHVANPTKNDLSKQARSNCDVYQRGDGINVNDISAIQQYIARIVSSLPV